MTSAQTIGMEVVACFQRGDDRRAIGEDDIRLEPDELGHIPVNLRLVTCCITVFDTDGFTIDPAEYFEAFVEGFEASPRIRIILCNQHEYADHGHLPRLLRSRRYRPRCRRATDKCDEFASPHRLALKQRVLPYHAVGRIVHHGKFWLPMSALGQKRTSEGV